MAAPECHRGLRIPESPRTYAARKDRINRVKRYEIHVLRGARRSQPEVAQSTASAQVAIPEPAELMAEDLQRRSVPGQPVVEGVSEPDCALAAWRERRGLEVNRLVVSYVHAELRAGRSYPRRTIRHHSV